MIVAKGVRVPSFAFFRDLFTVAKPASVRFFERIYGKQK